jgi:hypothetical protein
LVDSVEKIMMHGIANSKSNDHICGFFKLRDSLVRHLFDRYFSLTPDITAERLLLSEAAPSVYMPIILLGIASLEPCT